MSIDMATADVDLPIPIFLSGNKHYVFSITHAAYLRAHHRVVGVLIGTLPQSPQQNVFLGLPVQLMAEEARLLVRKGVCFVVSNASAHREGLRRLCSPEGEQERLRWLETLRDAGMEANRAREALSKSKMERALGKMDSAKREQALRSLAARQRAESMQQVSVTTNDEDGSIFPSYDQAFSPTLKPKSISDEPAALAVTPTSSYPPLSVPQPQTSSRLPPAPASYPLFAYLHSLPGSSYHSSPGLRFGCEYLVYPGDPLRFHSHFLAVGRGWRDEFELLQLIGGGRLGTGVKKGFLVGGVEERDEDFTDQVQARAQSVEVGEDEEEDDGVSRVRCFCIEWAGM